MRLVYNDDFPNFYCPWCKIPLEEEEGEPYIDETVACPECGKQFLLQTQCKITYLVKKRSKR